MGEIVNPPRGRKGEGRWREESAAAAERAAPKAANETARAEPERDRDRRRQVDRGGRP